MDPVLVGAHQKFQDSILHFQRELSSIRAGRANPASIEDLPVMVYGTQMKLKEVGTISAPQTSLLTIEVWDATIVKDIQKSLMEANLGMNPSTEGNIIRLPIPPLTAERREEFVKAANKKGEEARIELRQIRAEERAAWDKAKDAGEFGEDELFRREKLLQDMVDKFSGNIDELVKLKEEELRQI